MSFDAQKTRFSALNDWFRTPQGMDIADFFSEELNHLNGFLYGETLLQLGSCGKNSWLQALHFSHKWLTSFDLNSSTTFMSSFNQLPIDRDSIDCVIAPLVLESFELSKSPIDEIDRILKPMGYVIFFGINPLSLWGLNFRIKRLSGYAPLKAKAKSVFSVQRAMAHRGYIQSYLSSFYYIPPVSSLEWLEKLEILNELGKMISPCPSGFYCLIMQKQQEITPNLLLNDKEEVWNRRIFQTNCLVKKT
ncbi:MAG: methyltransferase domain-containing protein [Tatlockia sp.]|nr:methyltransferase domain-containing protein [Tatlockia sp.]